MILKIFQVANETLGDDRNIYPTAVVKLVIKRDPSYFVTNVIIPSMFLSYLSIFVFLLPTEEGEKISLQVNSLRFKSGSLLVIIIKSSIRKTSGREFSIQRLLLVIKFPRNPLPEFYIIDRKCTKSFKFHCSTLLQKNYQVIEYINLLNCFLNLLSIV